jgi:hypothetical protein
MKRSLFLLIAICLSLLCAVQAAAQPQAPTEPPAVLQIFREEVKQGRNAAHETVEAGYVQAFTKAKFPSYYLGMTAVSGPNEAWFTVAYDSFAALEKDRQSVEKTPALAQQLAQLDQQDGEFRTGGRILLAVYRKELSIRPDRVMANLPQSRYFNVLTARARPGRDAEFAQAIRMYLAALEKANENAAGAAYQVVSGAPSGTYLFFIPMKSLEEIDTTRARESAVNQALGAEDGQKLLKLISEVFLTTESAIFAFSPKMSYVSKEFAAADPEFWAPKPKMAAKPAATPKKTGATQ